MFIRISSNSFSDVGSDVVNADITDHCMTVMWLEMKQSKMDKEFSANTVYIDFVKLNYLLKHQDWSEI